MSGIVAAVFVFGVLAAVTGLASGGAPPAAVSWLKLGLGVILLVVAMSRWHADHSGGDEPQLPGWMAAVDAFSPAKATGIAVILAVANPKNFALTLSAGVHAER
ncbi:hypothetical protein E1202_08430 [Saccharopolyspora karakumensis]|uniref:Uncharacterized protein n=1 Tax=Saccharopolyspora karakumensis TaxID=2530386 RepID=A0A4R5BWT6_9PSEU|nr:GAP family protein [Saccharopolyspora karakumensis]TDD90639.1 hypothetical protein E1202_08430 [Saccharopolyspora karakumensis]